MLNINGEKTYWSSLCHYRYWPIKNKQNKFMKRKILSDRTCIDHILKLTIHLKTKGHYFSHRKVVVWTAVHGCKLVKKIIRPVILSIFFIECPYPNYGLECDEICTVLYLNAAVWLVVNREVYACLIQSSLIYPMKTLPSLWQTFQFFLWSPFPVTSH